MKVKTFVISSPLNGDKIDAVLNEWLDANPKIYVHSITAEGLSGCVLYTISYTPWLDENEVDEITQDLENCRKLIAKNVILNEGDTIDS